jgi:uncharacterized protein (TIGR02246 family)
MKIPWLVIVLIPVQLLAQTPPPKSLSGQRIDKLVSQFEDAWNQHDAHAFAAVFTEDADFTNVIGMSAHGRKAIEDFHAARFSTTFKNSKLSATDVTIRFINRQVASVDVHWEMTGALDSSGAPVPLRKGLLNFIVTDHDDRWSIAVMHNQELAPPKN